jgi:hypothetical protein
MKRVNPCFQPRVLTLFRPNGITRKSARWIIWKLTEIYFGYRLGKLVGGILDQAIQADEHADESAVTVFVMSGEATTPNEIMASIAKRAQELLGTPEGMAKALEPEPWEKE